MLSSLPQRHPRYTLTLAVGVLFTLLLLVGQHSRTPRSFKFWGDGAETEFSVPTMGTEERIRISEELYKAALEDRKDMIQRYGPTVEKVQAFPDPATLHLYTLWDFYTPSPMSCPHRIQRVGNLGDGGKWMCGLERIADKPNCVVYSVGINGESSYEAAIIDGTKGCEVWGYDFSVNSFGPEIEKFPALKKRAHFHAYMLTDTDNPNSNPPTYTLKTLMRGNGHDWIDILKIDIEGAEFKALTDLLVAYKGQPLPFGQLQLEIHVRMDFKEYNKWWEALEEAGLRPFWTEPNLVFLNLFRGNAPTLAEYSFINLKGDHELVTDRGYKHGDNQY